MPQVQKPLCLIHCGVNPFSHFQLWGNKELDSPVCKDQEVGKLLEQNLLNRLQMVQFECPRYNNPCVCGVNPFSHFWLWGNKELDSLV